MISLRRTEYPPDIQGLPQCTHESPHVLNIPRCPEPTLLDCQVKECKIILEQSLLTGWLAD